MPFNIQGPELILILIIALLVLGPGKLPEVGSALGKSIREFRKAASEVKEAASVEPVKPSPAPEPPSTAVAPAVTPPAPAVSPAPPLAPVHPEPVVAAPAASDTDSTAR